MAHLIVLGYWRKADLITQGAVFWELLRRCKHEGIRNKYQICHLHLGISTTQNMLAIKGPEFRDILVKNGSMLEYAECDISNSCIKTIALSFNSKGMEIISKPCLKNLTHIDIESYQCIVNNIYMATHSTKADMTVYVYPQSRVALVPHSDIQLPGRETNTYVTMNVKTDDMGVYTCTAYNLVSTIITNTINTCFKPG